jgi:hypothetical protein
VLRSIVGRSSRTGPRREPPIYTDISAGAPAFPHHRPGIAPIEMGS